MEIRPLRPSDDRTRFRSGDADLDRFFQKYAGQNQFRLFVGTTYVAVESELIAGYATVAAADIEGEVLPMSLRRRLPAYPLPVLRLARLAVDSEARGEGIGTALLSFVMGLAAKMADEMGCSGVLVDAKPTAIEFYERYGFFVLEGFAGVATPMFLPINDIKRALRG